MYHAHVYFTDGMFEWGKLLIESLLKHISVDINVIASTRDLTEDKVEELSEIATVLNKSFDIDTLADIAEISKEKLLKMKNQVETGYTTDENQLWKWLIAGGDRIYELDTVMSYYISKNDIFVHFDADTYFRSDVANIFRYAEDHDVIMRQRPNDPNIIRRAVISMMGFKINHKSRKFMKRWIDRIEQVDIHNTTKTFDQRTCYETILELQNEISIGNYKEKKHFPKISVKEEGDADIWFGNCLHRGKKLLKFKEDFTNDSFKNKGG